MLKNPEDPQEVKYINYSHDEKNPNSLFDNIIYTISEDTSTHKLWVGTSSGLSILNDINDVNSFTNYSPHDSSEILLYNEVNSIIQDSSGLMWLGTLGGGIHIINTKDLLFCTHPIQEVENKLTSNAVRSICVSNDNTLWMGIGRFGIVSYDHQTGKFTYYNEEKEFRNYDINATVFSIIESENSNSLWFSTHGKGVFVCTYSQAPKIQQVTNLNTQTHSWLTDDCVFSLSESYNGHIWMGTANGVSVYNPKKDTGFAYQTLPRETNASENIHVLSILESDPNTIWMSTEKDGIFKINKHPLSSELISCEQYCMENSKTINNNVQSLYIDSDNRIWAGMIGGGLNLYDPDKDIFVPVQKKYNIPGHSINGIIEDDVGDLWLSTNEGLAVIKFSTNIFAGETSLQHYNLSDGLTESVFSSNSFFKTNDRSILVGGFKGYVQFYPEKFNQVRYVTPLVISDIIINNKSLMSYDESTRTQISELIPGYSKEIHLTHKQNNFGFEFVCLDYLGKQQKYAYKLIGFDEDWQYTDNNRRFAYYTNMKSGNYNFRVKAVDNKQITSNMVDVKLTILPAPWMTKWAFLLYAILFLLVSYFLFKLFKSKLVLKNKLHLKNLENQQSKELNHAKLQFFTNVTHEFITPLTILSASLDQLLISYNTQDNGTFEIMRENVNRLNRLFQQILEFRKAESGNLKLKVAQADIANFIRLNLENFKPLCNKNKIHFSAIIDPEVIIGYFDSDKIDKILSNLLSNAVKYNQPGGFVQVNVNLDEKDQNQLVIVVKDSGSGISNQAMKNLFKRFYEHEQKTYSTTGTGIGLSLTKELVNLHHGNIDVQSELGVGTTFYVRLPLNVESYSENEIAELSKEDSLKKGVINSSFNKSIDVTEDIKEQRHLHSILIVEDDDELLNIMVKLLNVKYNVFTATNAIEGLKVLKNTNIDLIVSDIMMPEMDGIEFCKKVKSIAEYSHIPIILLTAKNQEEDRAEAYNSGANGFISKPFNLQVLYSKIASLLLYEEKIAQEFKQMYALKLKNVDFSSMDEEFMDQAINCIYHNIGNSDFDSQQFADALGVSKSTLFKKLKSYTGLNPSSIIREIRLKTACQIIEDKKNIRISDLAYAVGFNNPKYFSTCFKDKYGVVPSEYNKNTPQ